MEKKIAQSSLEKVKTPYWDEKGTAFILCSCMKVKVPGNVQWGHSEDAQHRVSLSGSMWPKWLCLFTLNMGRISNPQVLVLRGKTSEKRLIMKTALTNDVRTPKAPDSSPPSSMMCEDIGNEGRRSL